MPDPVPDSPNSDSPMSDTPMAEELNLEFEIARGPTSSR